MTLSTPPNETSPSPTSTPSGSVLREYTSPTCKLQISANPSALEKWTRKPTLKNQRFLLRFEDPRLSEDQWVSLRGDRLKLAALTEAVTTYVQGFLGQSRTLNRTELTELTATPIAEPAQPLQGISLHPKGLLAHTLKLGTIATEATGESLSLTATQLADLASVLDEHSTATLDLPVLNRDTAWMRSPAAWSKIAALSLLSVGITASVLNQFSPKQTPVQIASQASSSDQRLTPPQVPQSTPSPTTTISSSKLPTTQVPATGATTPSIATESNPATSGIATQGTSNPDTEKKADTKPDTSDKTTNKPVESTTNPASKQASGGKLSGTVQPVPLAGQSKPLSNARQGSLPPAAPAAESADGGADPSIPAPDLTAQIEQIQNEISKTWSPPEKMSGEITYILEISPDGQVLSISPEREASPASQSKLPAIGKKIAPALSPVNSPYKVRVFFFPDGTVSVKKA